MGFDPVRLALAIEQEFELDISDDAATAMLTFGHMCEIVCDRLAERARQSGAAPIDEFQLVERLLAIQTAMRAEGIRCSSCDRYANPLVSCSDGWGFALCLDCVAAARDASARRISALTHVVDADTHNVEMPPCQFCWSRETADHTVDFGRGRVCNACLAIAMELFAE
jgi:hypothetical protein